MNIGQLGILANNAVQLAQTRVANVEQATQEHQTVQRELQAAEHANQAEGVGVAHEDSATGERDADGRLPWERSSPHPRAAASEPTPDEPRETSLHAKDPSGNAGTQLDIDG